jgi:uncharacterized protein (DUF2141 family)
MGLGCDTVKNVESKIPPEKSKSIAVYEPSLDRTVETPKQADTKSITVSLKISISGFAHSDGSCRVAVYLGKAHFNDPEYAIAKESIDILDSKATWQVEIPIPLGTEQDGDAVPRLAVSAYHDENDNSRLDKNSFGIPTERYGFSNNPKRGYGPPKFSEAAMNLNSTEQLRDSNVTLEVPVLIK